MIGLPQGVKIRYVNGKHQVVWTREVNGVEFIKHHEDFSVVKQIVKAGDTGDVNGLMFHKDNKEMQDFVDNVSLLQSNYQLVIVKELLQTASATNPELFDSVKKYNPTKEIQNIQKPLELLTRKGFIRKNSEGQFEINSNLSNEKRTSLLQDSISRLGDVQN